MTASDVQANSQDQEKVRELESQIVDIKQQLSESRQNLDQTNNKSEEEIRELKT